MKIYDYLGEKPCISPCYSRIGEIYEAQANYSKALDYYFKSLKIIKELDDKPGLAGSYYSISGIYLKQGKINKALLYQMKSLKISQQINDKKRIAYGYINIGSIYYNQGNYDKALAYHIKSLKISQQINDIQGVVCCYVNIGEIYAIMCKYNEALKYYDKGLTLAKEIGYKDIIKEIYKSFSESYFKLNNYKKAYEYHKLYFAMHDSIFNEEGDKRFKEQEVKYETEKKEQQLKIANLNFAKEREKVQKQRAYFISGLGVLILLAFGGYILYRNREIKKRSRLEKELNQYMQKALGQQMNPHFIFNSLNSIQYYLLKNDKITSNKYLTKFARLMRVTLENSQHNTVTVEKEMEALGLYLELEQLRLEGKFDYEIKIDEEIEEQSDMIPTLLLQPFVENSIWHGLMNKQEKGKVTVDVKIVDNIIVCRIEDDGIGREKAMEINREKRKAHKSLGLEITNKRLELINSLYGKEMHTEVTDLKNEKNEGIGTRVEIFLPFMN